MAGPQDYLTVKGPEGASYSLPKFDLGSQIASLPTSYQEGQQYGVKRALQTAFKDGFPTDQQGNPDYNAMATRLLAIGGPEAAQPYFQMGLQQGNAAGNQAVLGGQPAPQGGQGNPPQTFTPMAPNAATGPSGITGEHPSTGGGSIFPYKPGTSPPQIMSGGPQGGAGLGGQPAPFAGNRDQQGAPPGPVGGGTITQDGTTGQPAVPTSSRETANNGQQDRRIVAADRLDAHAALILQQASRYGQSPAAVKTLQDRAQQLTDQAKQYREAALKDTEATPEQKNLTSGASEKTAIQKQEIDQSGKLYQSLVGQGRTGSTMVHDAQEARSLLQHPDMFTGLGAETAGKTVQLARLVGLPATSKLPDLQAELLKTTSNSVLNQMSLLKASSEEGGAGSAGRIFAPEVEQMIKSSASIENPTAANLYLTTLKERTGSFLSQIGQMAIKYKKEHGGILDAGFDQELSDKLGSHHAMTDQERQDPTLLSSREFSSPQEAMKAKVQPGETIRVRTGSGMLDFKYLHYGGVSKGGVSKRPMNL
jgi:hypothetical protein